MTQVISFLMSVLFTVGMFFIGLFPEKGLIVTQTAEGNEYYINGESESLRFGVVGDGNLFEPNDEIKVVFECLNESLDGKRAKISVRSEQNGFYKPGFVFVFDMHGNEIENGRKLTVTNSPIYIVY